MKTETKERYIKSSDAEELELMKEPQSETDIMYEDTRKREKNTKHFRLKNGNYRAVIYDHPVHKYDEESGRFVDISTDYGETENDYEAEFENYKVKFPKKDGKRRFITVNKGDKRFSWRYAFEKEGERNTRASAHLHSVNKNKWDNERAHIKYEKIDGKSDLEYSVNDGGIKESIILPECPENSVFSFEIKMHGLVPRLSENKKRVELVSDKAEFETAEAEMVIPEPNMIDNNGAYSEELHYEIRKTEKGTFLDVVAKNAWLADLDRVYPVTVDPMVKVIGGTVGFIKVVEVASGGVVNSTNKTMILGTSADNAYRVYVGIRRSDLPDLLEGYRIARAGFVLTKNTASSSSTEKYNIYAFDSISESNLNWNTSGTFGQDAIIKTITSNSGGYKGQIDISVKNKINEWYADTTDTNFCGIMIKKETEDTSSSSSISFGSNYATYIDERPRLYIEYTSEDIYADHQKNHTFEVGRAGTGAVNLFTGKLSFAHNDIVLNNSPLPISVSHLNRHIFTDTKYGTGWKLSAEQTIERVSQDGIYAIYTDSQGRKHYFSEDSTGKIVDQMGLGLTMVAECYDSVTYYKITDEKDTVMRFNSDGKLIEIKNAHNKTLTLTYDNMDLINIRDTNGKTVQFEYIDGQLNSVTDVDGDVLTYEYIGDLLKSVIYPYGDGITEKSEFEYYDNGLLKKVTDRAGVSYSFVYDNQNRVTEINCTGQYEIRDGSVTSGSTVSEDSVLIEYRNGVTAVKNARTGIKNVYKFDECGRVISTYVDMSDAADTSMRTQTTLTELLGYTARMGTDELTTMGRYRSKEVAMNTDCENQKQYLKNTGFYDTATETASLANWTVGSGSNGQIVASDAFGDKCSAYCMTNTTAEQSNEISQTVQINTNLEDSNILVASAWAKIPESCATAKCRLHYIFEYGGEFGTEEYYDDFDTEYTGWQYLAIPVALKQQDLPLAVTVKLEFKNAPITSSNQSVSCMFSNIRLTAVNGTITSNIYSNSNGCREVFGTMQTIKRIINKKDSRYLVSEYYNDSSDLVEVFTRKPTDLEGFNVYNEYDSEHNLVKTMDWRGIITEYTYNSFGKVLTQKSYKEGEANNYRLTEYTYDSDGIQMLSETAPRYYHNGVALIREYEYDNRGRGLVTNMIDFNGQEYVNDYDSKTDEQTTLSSEDNDSGVTLQNNFSYTRGYLTKLTHNNFNFGFTFDSLGREKSVSVENEILFNKSYSKSNTTETLTTIYASGEESVLITDSRGNPTSRTYKGAYDSTSRAIFSAKYDGAGILTEYIDNEAGICYNYTYDKHGNVTEVLEKDSATGATLRTNTYVYDTEAHNKVLSTTYGATGQKYIPIYEQNSAGDYYPDHAVIGVELETKQGNGYSVKYKVETQKDDLGRIHNNFIKLGNSNTSLLLQKYTYLKNEYPYASGKYITTDFVASVEDQICGEADKTTVYTYDKSGNIETVSEDNVLVAKYYYDKWNRLVREDNHKLAKTYTWSYDIGGNILEKRTYDLCTTDSLSGNYTSDTYIYETTGNRDRMACYNNECCAYDSLGNPYMYRCHDLSWTKVRKLASFDANTFEYNAEGIRFKKNNTVYTLDGDRILKETDGTKTITYYYGNGNAPIGFNYNGTDYYFRKNIQGDVVGIYNASGYIVARYVYDAWGNHKIYDANNNEVTSTTHIGYINPIRYRGYYFDVETNLYYLQTRYYDPETGRFLNSDAIEYLAPKQLGGLNLYAYCGDNPIASFDPFGNWTFAISFNATILLFGKGIDIGVGFAMSSDDFTFQLTYAASDDSITDVDQFGIVEAASINIQYTELSSVTELKGPMYAYGINAPISFDILSTEEQPVGWQIGVGPGVAYDIHKIKSFTYNTAVWETWNPTKRLIEWIKGN